MSYGMKAVAYVLITLFLGVVLRELGFKGARLIFLLGAVSVIGAAAIYVGKLVTAIGGIGVDTGEYAMSMLKIVGIGYVFGMCSDVCAELGDGTLSSSVCLIGRLEIMSVTLPYIKMIVEKGLEMI